MSNETYNLIVLLQSYIVAMLRHSGNIPDSLAKRFIEALEELLGEKNE